MESSPLATSWATAQRRWSASIACDRAASCRLWAITTRQPRGSSDSRQFNPIAAEACRWTTAHLSAEALVFLAELPRTLVEDSFTLAHGTPNDPIWDYLISYSQAVEAWERVNTSDVLVGHSHIQFSVEAGRGVEHPGPGGLTVPLGHARLVVNPGSVGQPRDRDPRAAYAVYDDDARIVSLRRVWYDVTETQRAMAEAQLPEALITRLSLGR